MGVVNSIFIPRSKQEKQIPGIRGLGRGRNPGRGLIRGLGREGRRPEIITNKCPDINRNVCHLN